MYKRILVPLEHSPYDETILTHVRKLARHCGASLVLIHVADGWAARNVKQLNLRESEEMKNDRAYLEGLRNELAAPGRTVDVQLALGDPASELVKIANSGNIDLLAMTTHGHRYLSDLVHGTTVDRVRHLVNVPVLLLKVQ